MVSVTVLMISGQDKLVEILIVSCMSTFMFYCKYHFYICLLICVLKVMPCITAVCLLKTDPGNNQGIFNDELEAIMCKLPVILLHF